MNRNSLRVLPLIALACLLPAIVSGGARRPGPEARVLVSNPTPPAHVTHLASYDFDDGLGGPDAQGWVSVDLSAQLDTFTHVDDFAGLPAPWEAIEGSRSMWIGARPAAELCSYVNLPGYGNNWLERLESATFATSGDVELSYHIAYHSEDGYDMTHLEYLTKNDAWQWLATYEGGLLGPTPIKEFASHTIPADSLDGSARFRFTFASDGAVSDADGLLGFGDTDGAAIFDSITVSDNTGVIDFENFESAPVGARASADGDWYCGSSQYFGDFAGLFDGSTVLQDDPGETNNSYLWGFFNGSTDTYACGGHPEQASVPLAPIAGHASPKVRIANAILSPIIDVRVDKDGFPVASPPDQVVIEYDVYVDIVADNYIGYDVDIARYYNDCLDAGWSGVNPANNAPNQTWFREQHVAPINEQVTHVQFRLIAWDHPSGDDHTCNSHTPLFDNIDVYGWFDTASDAETPAVSDYALHANVPNPFNPGTTIAFDVPDGGGDVRLSVYDVSGRWVTTLVDGWRQGGRNTVTWDGRDSAGQPAATGVYFYRMQAPGMDASRKMVLLK